MSRILSVFYLVLAVALAASLSACRGGGLPDPSSEEYADAVAAFYAGIAGIEAGAHQQAEQYLTRVTELAPDEPAAWANLGLLALRENRLDAANEHLDRAGALSPEYGRIYFLKGILEQRRGRSQEAIEHFRRSVELDPDDLRAIYALMQEIERQGGDRDGYETARLIDDILSAQPENLAVLLEQARLGALHLDADLLRSAVTRIAQQGTNWPDGIQERLRTLQELAAQSAFEESILQIALLQNDLQQLATYRKNLAAVQNTAGQEGEPITRFLRLPTPSNAAAAADTSLHFTPEALSIDGGPWEWVRPLPLTGNRVPTLVVANGKTVKLGTGATFPFPGGPSFAEPSRDGIAAIDYDNDYKMDLALAGNGGLRLFRQESHNTFTDVTMETGLPAAVLRAAYAGVWVADLDQEGDLDLVLASLNSAPRVLRNNGDGTFSTWALFGDVIGLRDFTWADLDADGDLDVALLDDAGRLHAFRNERTGQFARFDELQPEMAILAVTAADLDNDSRMELVALQSNGTIQRFSATHDGAAWETSTVARWSERPGDFQSASLFAADLDNNGGLDLLAATPAGGQVWLSDVHGRLQPLVEPPGPRVFDVADLSGSGRLDLVSLSQDGQIVHRLNQGERNYRSKSIQLQSARTMGDQRINSFGIGGTVEIRSGLHYQKQRITAPAVHFGLGDRDVVHVARITWPNGTVQAEFDLETDQTVLARQRLKGSCPWVFTHDGEEMRFVTDFLWRTALGLRVNAQEGTNVMHDVDWVKIDADELAARDGLYDVRITAELWETHFFDQIALMTADHRADTEIFVDERFAIPAPDWAVHAMTPPRAVARAVDGRGRDVTEFVSDLDGRYLDTFELGPYQGLAEHHLVEVFLGEDAPTSGPLWLVASGWVRPTDSSINFAISQGSQEPPTGVSIDVPDGDGGWKTVRSNIGFPAGKSKTMLIDLRDVFSPVAPRRMRLRSTMEIYWDQLAWARGQPDAEVRTQRITAASALLRYRGFSVVKQASHSAPELPDYHKLAATTPLWRDLVGYYTRFGDVRELVEETDDRYVIMNAGDELTLTFAAPPPPPEGWVRDFVLIGDGWVKDGDYNTGHSKTVRPLPYHGLDDYSTPPGRLQDDPAYRRHPHDWRDYHTRFVTPDRFQQTLTTR